MRRKMIQPLPAALGEAPSARFKRFTKALLTVPKGEIETLEQQLSRLEAEKERIERKIAAVGQEMAKRNKITADSRS
jgi:hypothetical protein